MSFGKLIPASALFLIAAGAAVAQTPPTRAVAVPGSLAADGIPPISAAVIEEVGRYTESRSATLSAWHPTLRQMLISTRFGNTPQLHRVANPLGARSQITYFDEPVSVASFEPHLGRYFLFTRDIGGNEFAQIYRFDLPGGKVTLLTDGGRSQNGGMRWSSGGNLIAYGTTRRNGADRDIHIMDPVNPRSDRALVTATGGGWGVLDWAPDDRTLLVSEELSVNRSHLYLVNAATGQRSPLVPSESDTVAHGNAEFSRDGGGVYFTGDDGSDYLRLSYVDLATRRVTPLTSAIKWDVDEFALSDDGGTVAFTTNEAGLSHLYLMDARSRTYKQVASVPAGVISGLRWRPHSTELGFNISSARSPSDVYSLDARTGRLTRWTESELGGLVASELSEPSLIKWKSFDGRELSGFYYRPAAKFTGKRPVIINIHGGPEGQSLPTFIGRGNYFLNELGVAVIYPNVRGSTGYGKSFVKLDNGMKRLESVRDIGALLDWIATQPDLDASRVMVTGGSYGGYMTLAVATMYNVRICCSLDVVGISNFNTFLANTESYRRDLRRAEYGDERKPEMREFFERTAPVNNAGKITKPLFIVAGFNDPRVPHTEAEQMVARVKANGTPVWYLLGKDEGHGFRKKVNQDFQFYATVEFIRRYLMSGTRP